MPTNVPPANNEGDAYEYRNRTHDRPHGPFQLDLLPELRRKGYFGSGSCIRVNGSEWMSVRDIGIPLSYPSSSRIPALVLVALLWLLCLLASDWNMPVDAQTGNGLPNIWTFTVDHQWWRLLTGAFLSPGPVPLCIATGLVLLMGPFVIPFLGTYGFMLLYILCGIGGSFAMLEWFIPHLGSTEDIVSLYKYQSMPVPGLLSAGYGILGAALVLCPRRPCGSELVRTWVVVILIGTMTASAFAPLSGMVVPYTRLALLGLLLGIVFASPCAVLHAFRSRQCGIRRQPDNRFLSVPTMCSVALWVILAGAWVNYKQTGKDSAIAAEEESRCFLHGSGRPQYDLLAWSRLQQAARKGYPFAYEAMAYSYMYDPYAVHSHKFRSVEYDPKQYLSLALKFDRSANHQERVVEWMRKAARYGFPNAATELGIALMNGHGCQRNRTEARLWLTHAQTRKANIALGRLNDEESSLKDSYYIRYRKIRTFFRSCFAPVTDD